MFSILMAKNTKISNNMKTGIVGKHIVVMWTEVSYGIAECRTRVRQIRNLNITANIRCELQEFHYFVRIVSRIHYFTSKSYLLNYKVSLRVASSGIYRRSSCHLILRWFLARLILRPWRWRRHVAPKREITFHGLYAVISQKIEIFMITAVRTSNLAYELSCFAVYIPNTLKNEERNNVSFY
jgi:hypothetical protein